MACGIALLTIISILCTFQSAECFQFKAPSKLTFGARSSKEKAVDDKKMIEITTKLNKLRKENLEIQQSRKGDAEKMTKMKNSMEEMERQLSEATSRLQEQCTRSDEQSSALLALLDDKGEGNSLLKFENAFTSSFWSDIEDIGQRAIDGNKNPVFPDGSCSHSADDDPAPWWLGELSERSRISSVELTNRADCCGFRMNTISVEVFETDPRTDTDAEPQLCGKIDEDPQLLVKVECEQLVWGKYLRVYKHKSEPLQLCEVEVFGNIDKKLKMAMQSSEEASSALAIDEDSKTCSETGNDPEKKSWWQVQVPENKTVTGVVITNRDDEMYIFLSDFKVTVHKTFPSVCADIDDIICIRHKGTVGQGETVTLTCDRPMTGRFLRITKVNGGMLSLCDVRLLDTEN